MLATTNGDRLLLGYGDVECGSAFLQTAEFDGGSFNVRTGTQPLIVLGRACALKSSN